MWVAIFGGTHLLIFKDPELIGSYGVNLEDHQKVFEILIKRKQFSVPLHVLHISGHMNLTRVCLD